MSDPTEQPDEPEPVWPEPRDDPDEEPSHRAARIADRDAGAERGDVDDAEEGNDDAHT